MNSGVLLRVLLTFILNHRIGKIDDTNAMPLRLLIWIFLDVPM